MTTKEMIAVMQAYEDGKKIQLSNKNNEWRDWTIPLEPTWNWVDYDFRIKPEEEKPVRMTNRQLAEWVAKGFGEWCTFGFLVHLQWDYEKGKENSLVDEGALIRPWGSDEWIEPTVDIYNRDCKGE